jgi:hypothetical protein
VPAVSFAASTALVVQTRLSGFPRALAALSFTLAPLIDDSPASDKK